MNAYTAETPPAIVAIAAAAALAVLTIGALVVAPAQLDSGRAPDAVVARAAAPSEVSISPARIDVIAIRTPNVAWALEDNTKPNCKPEV